IRSKIADFEKTFERRATDTGCKLLRDSRERVEKERDRYGIKIQDETILGIKYGTDFSMAENAETDGLKKAAAALLEKYQPVSDQWEVVTKYVPRPDSVPPPPPPGPDGPELFAREKAEALRKYDEVIKAYSIERAKQESAYPILAAYQLDPETYVT